MNVDLSRPDDGISVWPTLLVADMDETRWVPDNQQKAPFHPSGLGTPGATHTSVFRLEIRRRTIPT